MRMLERGMLTIVGTDTVSQWAGSVWAWLQDALIGLLDIAIAVADGVTADHLEGAGVMAAVLLGPSLVIGLSHGFWQGLRIEWRRFRGQPRAIDGDTFEIRGERIRLFGIDAPEMGQPWWDENGIERDAGASGRDALASLIDGRKLAIKVLREDRYGRSVAIVKVDGRDVGRSLVRQGFAFATPGSTRYRRAELSARRRKRGLWRGELEKPWDYRQAA